MSVRMAILEKVKIKRWSHFLERKLGGRQSEVQATSRRWEQSLVHLQLDYVRMLQ